MKYDVIIVGAGPGGIFAAYELMQKKPSLKVAVFEAGHALSRRRCPHARTFGPCVCSAPFSLAADPAQRHPADTFLLGRRQPAVQVEADRGVIRTDKLDHPVAAAKANALAAESAVVPDRGQPVQSAKDVGCRVSAHRHC